MNDRQEHYSAAETIALGGLGPEERAAAQPYVHHVVDDWLRQADEEASLDRADLMAVGLADLEAVIRGTASGERVAALQVMALRPGVDRASAGAFDLATQVADGQATRAEVGRSATSLHARIVELMGDVKAVKDEDTRRILMRSLTDADLEVRYVLEVEVGALSFRLNRHING
jgi:hypothetical protein